MAGGDVGRNVCIDNPFLQEERNTSERFPFDVSDFPFDEATCSTLVHKRRQHTTKQLFIDALLELAGVRKARAYFPPRNPDALHLLYETYTTASEVHLWKDCITYYLLRWWPDNGLCARNFQNKRYLPPEYSQLTTAYFFMDRGDTKVCSLIQPELVR